MACGAFSRFILSSVRFARTSCIIPINVLPMTIGRKVRFRKEPTRQSKTVMIKKIRLKYVNVLETIISFVVLSVDRSLSFVRP